MATPLGESFGYLLTMQMLTAVTFIATTYLVIIQSLSFYRQVKSHANQTSRLLSKIYAANAFTTIYLLSLSSQSLFSVITTFGVGMRGSSCQAIISVHFGFNTLALGCKWFVFIFRLTVIYNSSTYEYSSLKMRLLRLFLFFYLLGLLIWVWIDIRSEIVIVNSLHLCTFEVNNVILALVNLMDIVLSISIMVMFVRPMYQLAKANSTTKFETASQGKLQTVRRWKRLILKYFTTTLVATLSTTLLIVFTVLLGNGKLICMDNLLNAFCLVLMCKGFDKRYDILCCGCIAIFRPIFNKAANSIVGTMELSKVTSQSNVTAPTSRNASSYDPQAAGPDSPRIGAVSPPECIGAVSPLESPRTVGISPPVTPRAEA